MKKNSNQQIPIYSFEPETGLYCGEHLAQYIDGKPVVPPDATTVAPTPEPPGYINVWDSLTEQWTHEKGINTTSQTMSLFTVSIIVTTRKHLTIPASFRQRNISMQAILMFKRYSRSMEG